MENEENQIKSVVFKIDNLDWGTESPNLSLPRDFIEKQNESENEMATYLAAGEGNRNETGLDLAEFHEVINSILELLGVFEDETIIIEDVDENDISSDEHSILGLLDGFEDETIHIVDDVDPNDISYDENCSETSSELQRSVHEDSGLCTSLTDELIKLIDS